MGDLRKEGQVRDRPAVRHIKKITGNGGGKRPIPILCTDTPGMVSIVIFLLFTSADDEDGVHKPQCWKRRAVEQSSNVRPKSPGVGTRDAGNTHTHTCTHAKGKFTVIHIMTYIQQNLLLACHHPLHKASKERHKETNPKLKAEQ